MEMPAVFKALGDPTRYAIFEMLLKEKRCVRYLSRKLGITESAVSQHLKILTCAGLTEHEKFGYHTHYFASADALGLLASETEKMHEMAQNIAKENDECDCKKEKEESKDEHIA